MTEREANAHLNACPACRRAYLRARRTIVDGGLALDLACHGARRRAVVALDTLRAPGDVDGAALAVIVTELQAMHNADPSCAAAR